MSFKTTDEMHNFSFEDCVITKIEMGNDASVFELEALIVKAANSANANYTDSYASTAELRLDNMQVVSVVKEGYKYYDANDRLLEEVADEVIDSLSVKWNALFKDAYLCSFEVTEDADTKAATMEIELPTKEPGEIPTTYEISVTYKNAFVNWDHFMNKVQR